MSAHLARYELGVQSRLGRGLLVATPTSLALWGLVFWTFDLI
jgi:hypothetical protein